MKLPAGLNSWTLLLPTSETYRLPVVGSVAIAHGSEDLPAPVPRSSKLARDVPAVENSCTRPLLSSATYRFPPEIARPVSTEKPAAEPNPERYAPLPENSCTCTPRVFSTQTLPLASAATPVGSASWPAPVPIEPNLRMKVPVGENSWMRALP